MFSDLISIQDMDILILNALQRIHQIMNNWKLIYILLSRSKPHLIPVGAKILFIQMMRRRRCHFHLGDIT